MAARTQRGISLLVISLIAAVISLPMAASVASAIEARALAPVTQVVKTPVRIALDDSGAGGFYVTDPRSGGVLKYDPSGAFVRLLKTSGSPQGVAVMANGNLVVTMGGYAAVIDKVTGLEIRRLGSAGTATAFGFADGVAIDATGAIFVADAKSSKFLKFNANGDYLQSFGMFGDNGSQFAPVNNGNFYSPSGVTYDSVNNRIAITDVMMGNVKFFGTDGVPQGMVGGGAPDSGPGKFTSPMGIAFEYAGTPAALSRMYIVDSFQSSIQVLDPAGTTLAYIGDYGSTNGKLMVPSDAVYDKVNRRLIVANGYGNITIFGIDGGRNPLPTSGAAPPVLSVNQPLSIVNSSLLPLSGTVSAGASVSCALNGVLSFPATISGSAWNCSVAGLALGGNSIDVVARNSSPTEVRKSYQVTYALGGPNLTVTPVAQYVKVNPLPVSGTVDTGSTVQVCNPVATCYAATVDAAGNWSYSIPVVSGANTITVKATKVGISTKSFDTIFDNIPPVLTLSTVPTGSTVTRQVVNISGTVTDANLAGVSVGGQPVTIANNRFSYPVVGSTSVDVVATDLAGNATTQTIALSYNPSKIAMDFTSHADGAVVQTTPQTITGTLSGGTLPTVTVNGAVVATVGGTTWSTSVPLSLGLNTIIVVADGATSKLSLVYDPANPAVSAALPATDKADNKAVQITGVVGSNVTLTSVVNGLEAVQASNVPFTVSFSQEGVYPVVLKARDQLTGAVSQTVRNIIYDLTPPALTVNLASGPVTALSGTAEPGAVVKVMDLTTGLPISTASVAYVGTTWTATLGATLPSDNIDISATDAAGNVTSKTSFRPDGNINIAPTDSVVDYLDASVCMDIVLGVKTATRYQLAHGDIGPLVGGLSSPNGRIDVSDCILILRKASGLAVSW